MLENNHVDPKPMIQDFYCIQVLLRTGKLISKCSERSKNWDYLNHSFWGSEYMNVISWKWDAQGDLTETLWFFFQGYESIKQWVLLENRTFGIRLFTHFCITPWPCGICSLYVNITPSISKWKVENNHLPLSPAVYSLQTSHTYQQEFLCNTLNVSIPGDLMGFQFFDSLWKATRGL